MMENFKEYYGKRVIIIVDSIGCMPAYGPGFNIPLEFEATLISEADELLKLEDICIFNIMRHGERFPKGSLSKDYIIGVFEIGEGV